MLSLKTMNAAAVSVARAGHVAHINAGRLWSIAQEHVSIFPPGEPPSAPSTSEAILSVEFAEEPKTLRRYSVPNLMMNHGQRC